MTATISAPKETAEIAGFRLQIPSSLQLLGDRFYEFCGANPDLHIERDKEGNVLIMAPAGGETGSSNSQIAIQLGIWTKQDGTGVSFDSSTGFVLPDSATYSPDASWVLRSRLATLTREQKRKFLPLAPDFVIELRSPTDTLSVLQSKMTEYIANGVRLGWLIDPIADDRVYVYRPGREVEELLAPATVSGGPELPGFTLDLAEIWNPPF